MIAFIWLFRYQKIDILTIKSQIITYRKIIICILRCTSLNRTKFDKKTIQN
ncbi:hypothetical protein CPter91_2518 [Collimonas pratensis]|uniref:Uncharacterized protein n=1 Tax=Collimonas pratensis TaxID=279113 RepID=A0A127Q4D2_9BURK|nr:hypothetical protein CPter91_2518 [Collimonas pratensis]